MIYFPRLDSGCQVLRCRTDCRSLLDNHIIWPLFGCTDYGDTDLVYVTVLIVCMENMCLSIRNASLGM